MKSHFISKMLLSVTLLCITVSGCSRRHVEVPMNCYGRMLTPSGWEDEIYFPGMVNIGRVSQTGLANQFVLIESSAFTIKEQFLSAEANLDKTDHRVLAQDETPISIDFRLVFTAPDPKKDKENEERLRRLFALGNPKRTDIERVMKVDLATLYSDLTELYIRNKIRDIGRTFKDFSDAFKHQAEYNNMVREAVLSILKERNVPLDLIDVQISNIKPDPLVWQNLVKLQAVEAEISAIKVREQLLKESEIARFIYKLEKLKEIAQTGAEKGNTVIVITDTSAGLTPLQATVPALAPELLSDKKKE